MPNADLKEQEAGQGLVIFYALCPYCDGLTKVGEIIPRKISCSECNRQGMAGSFRIFASCLIEVPWK